MKNRLLLVFFVFCNSLIMMAQPPQGGGQRMSVEDRAKRTTEWMTKELNLTEAQVAPVDSVNLLFAKAQQLLFQSAEGDRDKIREAMTALEKEKENALSKILTSDQLETYKTKAKEMMSRAKGNRGQ